MERMSQGVKILCCVLAFETAKLNLCEHILN